VTTLTWPHLDAGMEHPSAHTETGGCVDHDAQTTRQRVEVCIGEREEFDMHRTSQAVAESPEPSHQADCSTRIR
jgi:hypothetical protein